MLPFFKDHEYVENKVELKTKILGITILHWFLVPALYRPPMFRTAVFLNLTLSKEKTQGKKGLN